MIVAEVVAVTVLLETVKVALVLPAATVTEAGTTAAALLLVNDTETPPVGAATAQGDGTRRGRAAGDARGIDRDRGEGRAHRRRNGKGRSLAHTVVAGSDRGGSRRRDRAAGDGKGGTGASGSHCD